MPPTLELAPLHGVTNRIYRDTFARHFPDFDGAMAPFILSVGSPGMKASHYKDLDSEYTNRLPVIPQVMSANAEEFVHTGLVLSELGYNEVNWNLGCPYPMVTKKKRGAGLLPYPELVRRFLDAVCNTINVRISVKLRLGLNDRDEILRILPVLNEFPLSRIIIHPRVATQLYGGDVDIDGFERARDISRHKIVYNGDITSVVSFDKLQRRFPGINEWMIGRGAIANPLLPGQIKGKATHADVCVVIQNFHDELYYRYRESLDGQRHVLDKMKEVWSYLSLSFYNKDGVIKIISKATSFDSYEDAVGTVLSSEKWRA